MRFLKKSARKKCRKKVPENRNFQRKNRNFDRKNWNFQRKNRKNIQYIQQTNSHKRLLVFSYGGKHESYKRNKDPS